MTVAVFAGSRAASASKPVSLHAFLASRSTIVILSSVMKSVAPPWRARNRTRGSHCPAFASKRSGSLAIRAVTVATLDFAPLRVSIARNRTCASNALDTRRTKKVSLRNPVIRLSCGQSIEVTGSVAFSINTVMASLKIRLAPRSERRNRSRRMTVRTLVAAQLVLLTWTSAAHAEHITDPATDFAIDFDPKNASVCVIYPTNRIDGGACGRLRPEQAEAAFANTAQKSLYVAIVRFPEWQFFVTIRNEIAEDIDVDAYTSGTSYSIAHRGTEILTPTTAQRTVVNGIPIVELSVGTRWLDGGAEQWISTYSLCGSQANYTIYAATDTAEHARQVKAIIDDALTTARLTPVHPRAGIPTTDFVSYTLRGIALVIVLLVVVGFAARQIAKRGSRSKPPRPPPPPPPREQPKPKRKPSKKIVWDRDRDGP